MKDKRGSGHKNRQGQRTDDSRPQKISRDLPMLTDQKSEGKISFLEV
jgi:hypothetical protein